jgi:predicted nucleic acid-binding protein
MDTLIAACAHSQGATLVTNNRDDIGLREFSGIGSARGAG